MSRHNFVAKRLAARNLHQRIIPDKRRVTRDWYLEWEPGDWLDGVHPRFDSLAGAEADAVHDIPMTDAGIK